MELAFLFLRLERFILGSVFRVVNVACFVFVTHGFWMYLFSEKVGLIDSPLLGDGGGMLVSDYCMLSLRKVWKLLQVWMASLDACTGFQFS